MSVGTFFLRYTGSNSTKFLRRKPFMINKSIVDGFTSLDGCYKLSDSDCTIDCYVIPRSILERKQEIDDWELKTNSVYLLIGKQNDKIMAYAGKGEIGMQN